MDFPSRLRMLRSERKVSQSDLGKEIGVTLKQIQRYESASSEPTLPKLLSLADFFNVSLDYLAGRSDDPTRH